jgi:hypothetical protein
MKKLGCAFVVFVFLLACASSGFAQSKTTTGTVEGDVVDERGGGVPGATVETKNLDTNFTQTEKTNSDGHFAFLNLAPGRYQLTISQPGFATILQQNVNLTVGQVITIPVTMKISTVSQQIVVTDVPVIEVTKTESSSTLDQVIVANTPVLGRKFEDLLTLTPGVAITQGPDGDEINFNGQRGIFNNVSLDGGDYNNGFFGEQEGGQRAAIDITLDAVKEFQVVASGANAEFGRTAGGVVNVITKSGTNNIHGSAFEYFRTEALTAATSDGKPLDNFLRNQFGGSIGGPIIKDKLFFFGAGEGIRENLRRKNLSVPIGTPCSSSSLAFDGTPATDALISASADCQRVALLNFMQSHFKENDGAPVDHLIRNGAAFGRVDYNLNPRNQIFGSYNFDYSKNSNQTFDVPAYGTTANGIEGPSKIQAINTNWFSTISNSILNEAHFTYARENRPRNATAPNSVPDTNIGSSNGASAFAFRFGQPFFLEPTVDEVFWRTDVRDNFTVIHGKHTFKTGGEWVHSNNTQIFRGFFTGLYFFDSPVGFMHYVTNGPTVQECSNGTFVVPPATCGAGSTFTGGPLFLFLQHGPATQGETFDQSGFSSINNEEFALFLQDTWKVTRNLTLNYGLRWEAQHFPDPVIPPSQTAYGVNLTNPNFPSTGKLPNQNKMFQPRIGFAWDIKGNGKSALRASWGIFNARQNMLTQVGAITTNGVQQQSFAAGSAFGAPPVFGQNAGPINNPPAKGTPPPPGASITVFSKDYANPRIYTTNVGYEQEIFSGWAGYLDFTLSKGVHLTRFTNPNVCCSSADLIPTGDVNLGSGPSYTGPAPFPNLGGITDTVSSAKSLYRGATIGVRKRFSNRFQLDANYVWSEDLDDDSNERDPFSFRYYDLFNLKKEYSYSDRDEKHKFNLITRVQLPFSVDLDVRMQAHSAQPYSANPNATGVGPLCSNSQAQHRVQLGLGPGGSNVDCGRNFLRKDNGFFAFNFGAARPFHLGERVQLVPKVEVFNLFNNKNSINTISGSGTPLFDFDGYIRQGVGDPREAQLSLRLIF